MGRLRWALAPLIAIPAAVAGLPQPAMAACHAFTVEVSPAAVIEGSTVTVTVRRDAGVASSQVDVETVAETAQAAVDFVELRQTVAFGVGPTEQTLSVQTIDDGSPEQSETFRLHLSNPAGCAVNRNLTVGPDATVTVGDNDVAPTEPPPTEPPPTAPPSTTGRSTTVPPSTTGTTSTLPTTSSAAVSTSATTAPGDHASGSGTDSDDGDNGGSRALMAVLAAALAAAVGLAGWRVRQRLARPSRGS